MKEHIEYVAGFLFDPFRSLVVLIKKNRPAWQAGRLNGVGGHIERKTQGHTCYDVVCDQSNFDPCTCPMETPEEAMRREFWEETGVDVASWEKFMVLQSRPAAWKVHFFRAFDEAILDDQIRTMTDEEVGIYSLREVLLDPTILVVRNLLWILPMALTVPAEARLVVEEAA